ncbi:MAG: NTPase [Desulfurococcaceae archaeon]
MIFIITGKPGVGKSTLFNDVVEMLIKNNYVVGGVKTPEVRDKGIRIGFKIIDIMTGEEAWLAKKGIPGNVRIGSYTIMVDQASSLVERALKRAIESAMVIGVDEVGPMELKLPVFKPMLIRAIESGKPIILVIHYNLSDIDILKRIEKTLKRVTLTIENREELRKRFPKEVLEILAKTGSVK